MWATRRVVQALREFETEPRTVADIERQLAERGDRYPTVVVDRNGDVVAFAGAGSYRGRAMTRLRSTRYTSSDRTAAAALVPSRSARWSTRPSDAGF
jgi:hypothetical protein